MLCKLTVRAALLRRVSCSLLVELTYDVTEAAYHETGRGGRDRLPNITNAEIHLLLSVCEV
jgi:hypothetical protein